MKVIAMKTIELSLDCCVAVPDDFQDDEIEVVIDGMQQQLLDEVYWTEDILLQPPVATWIRDANGSLEKIEDLDASFLADENSEAPEPAFQQ
jgi:hypothetical protein